MSSTPVVCDVNGISMEFGHGRPHLHPAARIDQSLSQGCGMRKRGLNVTKRASHLSDRGDEISIRGQTETPAFEGPAFLISCNIRLAALIC